MDKLKSMLWFGGKVLIALAVLNFITVTLLKVSVFSFISDPIGTVTSGVGSITGRIQGTQ
jgi:hypothetical protein